MDYFSVQNHIGLDPTDIPGTLYYILLVYRLPYSTGIPGMRYRCALRTVRVSLRTDIVLSTAPLLAAPYDYVRVTWATTVVGISIKYYQARSTASSTI